MIHTPWYSNLKQAEGELTNQHISVPNFSIYHIILYILKFLCCFLILGQLFTLNLQHSKKCIQHRIYTIFDQIYSFSLFIFIHTHLQRVTLITRKGIFIFHISNQEVVWIGIVSNDKVQMHNRFLWFQPWRYWRKMQCMFPRVEYQYLDRMPRISGSVPGAWAYPAVW